MTDKDLKKEQLTDKLQKVRNDFDRILRDCDLSQQEYNSLMDDMKRRRRRIDGAGDSIFDDIIEE
jgi:recombination DNA repair RAD52 pathway protein